MERRYQLDTAPTLKKRAEGDDSPSIIEGYAAVYYDGTRATEYELWPGVLERIMPGAFDENLNDDVRALFNHKAELILGRNKANTLRLSVDDRGLRYEIDRAETTIWNDVACHLERGDVSGSSFAFSGAESVWKFDQEIADGEYTADVREITGFGRVADVGPVTYPAYEGTTSGARGANPFEEARQAWETARQIERGLRDRYRAAADLTNL